MLSNIFSSHPIFFELALIVPELIVLGAAFIITIWGAWAGDRAFNKITLFSGAAVLVSLYILLGVIDHPPVQLFNHQFAISSVSMVFKVIILVGCFLSLWVVKGSAHIAKVRRFETPLLMLLASLGGMLMVSANSFFSLYLALELLSLPLYVLAASARDESTSSEAGLKYFVLGALASGLLLFGISFIYGATGQLSFDTLPQALLNETARLPLIIGLVLVLTGLAFKVSAVPFHMWTPDVYEGSPTPVTAFMAMVPKAAAVGLLMVVLYGPLRVLILDWQPIVLLMAVLSMVLGAIAGVAQKNIVRLLAYSSIGHVGFLLLGLGLGQPAGLSAVAFYVAAYIFMTAGAFALVLSLRNKQQFMSDIADYAGLSKTKPMHALALMVILFSMAGIPLFVGFWAKYVVLMAAIQTGFVTLTIIGVIASAVAAYYYIRIVKVMYFDEVSKKVSPTHSRTLTVLGVLMAFVNVGLFVYPDAIQDLVARVISII